MQLNPRIIGSTQLFTLDEESEKKRLKIIKEEQKERKKQMKIRDRFLKVWS